MALLEYNPENCGNMSRAGKPMLSITNQGAFNLNREAQALLGLRQTDSQVTFFQDDEDETWYICAVEKGGFDLRTVGVPGKDGAYKLAFNNSKLADLIYAACGNPEKGLRIPISDEALDVEGSGLSYPLITAAAKS